MLNNKKKDLRLLEHGFTEESGVSEKPLCAGGGFVGARHSVHRKGKLC